MTNLEATRRTRPRLLAALTAALLAVVTFALIPATPSTALVQIGAPQRPPASLDRRSGSIQPSAAALEAVRRLGAVVRWNRFGTPRSLIRYGDYLATGLPKDPVAAARTWIGTNRELFRLSDAGVRSLELYNDSPMVGSDGHAVLFRQRFGGLPAGVDGLIVVGVVDGKVAYVTSSAVGDGSVPERATLAPVDAWRKAAADAGVAATSPVSSTHREGTWTVFTVAGFSLLQRARLVAVPLPNGEVRAAYEANVVAVGNGVPVAYTSFVDARTGQVLVRRNRVDHVAQDLDNPKWRFFPAYPTLDHSSADSRSVGCWEFPSEGCDIPLDISVTTNPWDFNYLTGLPNETTIGNAAEDHENWLDPLVPTGTYRPISVDRNYIYPWTNQWFEEKCDPTVFTSLRRNDIDAAIANMFAGHNRMHDWSYILGFTEVNSNLQEDNFGLTSDLRAHDPEIGDVQAGAIVGGFPSYLGRDNANQLTLQDGIPGINNQYLWQPIPGAFYSPCVDGDFDMTVIGHEYTHAISNRMVGGPDDSIISFQGGAMGESWSDLAALEYLHEYGQVPVSGENPWAMGAYATGNEEVGIRNYALNAVPLNYSDIGFDLPGPEVHADAEIWSGVNFDIRRALIAKYNPQFPASNKKLQRRCANGVVPVTECPGNRRWIQIMFDAFLLELGDLSMLDARDAYLAADLMRFGGANQGLLWRQFAYRGLGEHAVSFPEDEQPIANFESAAASNEATVTFRTVALDDPGQPDVRADIYVGPFEARVSPTADTRPSTERPDTARFVPGTYQFVVQAKGYGIFRFSRTLSAGQTTTLTINLASNWASNIRGAETTGDGDNRIALIDDTESTVWTAKNLLPIPGVEGLQVTVDLAGGTHLVRRVNVSALLSEFEERFTALRQFEVWTCSPSIIDPNCDLPTSFTRIYTSPDDAFPAVAPRPLAPDLQLRTFDVPDTQASVVRLVVLTNQCVGGPDYRGEQDNDPLNITDCVLGSVGTASEVAAAEFQVFTSSSNVTTS